MFTLLKKRSVRVTFLVHLRIIYLFPIGKNHLAIPKIRNKTLALLLVDCKLLCNLTWLFNFAFSFDFQVLERRSRKRSEN